MPEMGLSGLEGGVEPKTPSLPLSLKQIDTWQAFFLQCAKGAG
jgi:hypothetical protein